MEYIDKVLALAKEFHESEDATERSEINEKIIGEAIGRREALSAQRDLSKKDAMIERMAKQIEELTAQIISLKAEKAGNETEEQED